ncbi:MAG: T9SS type A sorting domain-containing protein, partial [Bacteroidia bacterium]|nr:T9SS type A sorting domain-containing protein [Bacteroidia bacterium]
VWYGSAGYQSPFKIIGSSHPVSSVYIDMFNVLHIEFKGINLPDSSKSYLNSQGFVKFSVAPPVSIPNLTVVKNKAYITFDRNDPILTNEVFNTFVTTVPSVFSAGSDKTICSGQSVTLTATGATSYTWNTGQNTASIVVSPTTTTTYIVTGIVNSVSKKDTIIVNVNPKPTVNAGADQNICAGNSTTITATGASSYSWNTGQSTASFPVTPTSTTTYIVTGTSLGCSAKDTVIVTVKPLPNVNFTKIVNGANVQFTGPAGNTNYSWSFGDATPNSTVQSPLHVYTTNGKKYITLTAILNGCSGQKLDSVVISITAILNNISFIDNIDIYPNPTDNFVRIQLNAKKSASFNISLISIDGKIVQSKDYKNTSVINDEIDLKNYSSGIYMLNISAENEQAIYQLIKR